MTEASPGIDEKIRSDSKLVDQQFAAALPESFRNYVLLLPVPKHHARAAVIKETIFTVGSLDDEKLSKNNYYLVDANLQSVPTVNNLGGNIRFVTVAEDTIKELTWLNNFINKELGSVNESIVGVGGGALLNATAYIAEKKGVDFIAAPTTVLAAADSAVGGLVRINKVQAGRFEKSFYRSVYEPSQIVLDPQILAMLPERQINFGLSEVIKHGVYQSFALLEYLASDDFNPLANQNSLLKAICWTVALKNVAINHDPDSLAFGGSILRGGHKLALAIEQETRFRVSHGQAVAVGVYQDSLLHPAKVKMLDVIYKKLGLPKAKSELAS